MGARRRGQEPFDVQPLILLPLPLFTGHSAGPSSRDGITNEPAPTEAVKTLPAGGPRFGIFARGAEREAAGAAPRLAARSRQSPAGRRQTKLDASSVLPLPV